jgi:hypothetical protein
MRKLKSLASRAAKPASARLKPRPEPPERIRGLDTAPIDWAAHIREVIAAWFGIGAPKNTPAG